MLIEISNKTIYKYLALIAIMLVIIVSLMHGWHTTYRELDSFEVRLKQQELKIYALKEQLEVFKEMYIEIGVIDSATLADIIYASIATPQLERFPDQIESGAPEK